MYVCTVQNRDNNGRISSFKVIKKIFSCLVHCWALKLFTSRLIKPTRIQSDEF